MLTKDDRLILNFLPVSISNDSYKSYVSNYKSKESLGKLRKDYPNCIFYRVGAQVFCIQFSEGSTYGNEQILEVSRNHRMISRLISEHLLRNIDYNKYKVSWPEPLSFIDFSTDLVRTSSLGSKLEFLHIYPKISFDIKNIETNDGKNLFGVVIDVSAYFDISDSVKLLTSRGLDLKDMYVISKNNSKIGNSDWIHKTILGKIKSVEGDIVKLFDFKKNEQIASSECYPEARKDNVNHILQSALGSDYIKAKEEITKIIHKLTGGDGKISRINSLITEINSITNKKISLDLEFSTGNLLLSLNDFKIQINELPKPVYVYDPAKRKTHTWHNGGLNLYGPFDLESFHHKNPKIVVIVPNVYRGEVEKFMNAFKNGISGKGYYPQGFVKKYHLNGLQMEFIDVSSLTSQVYRESCLAALENTTYDLAIVIIEERFHERKGDDDPYLVTKSAFMSQGVPVQEIEIETIRQGEWSWPYILDNIALACYVKMGGTPWTLSTYEPIYHEIVIGMGTAMISEHRLGEPTRYVGITNVFGADGSYLLNNISKDVYMDNYRDELFQSLKSCIEYVSHRNAWQDGDNVRLIFHQQFKEFKREDIEAIKDFINSLGNYKTEFAFVHLSEEHPFQIYDMNQNGVVHKFDKNYSYKGLTKGKLVPQRGSLVQINSKEVLLTLTGPDQLLTPFQGMPKPLLVSLHRDSTFVDINYISKQIFQFTFLNWRGFNPTSMPVTISYSNLIASLLGRLKNVSNWNPDIIRTKLRTSRWFL